MPETLDNPTAPAAKARPLSLDYRNANPGEPSAATQASACSAKTPSAQNKDVLAATLDGMTVSTPANGLDVRGAGTQPAPVASAASRAILAGIGVLMVAIGAIGIFLPGIPTVGPLILASFLFAKSYPPLEQRLIRNRLFARYLGYLDGSVSMSTGVRLKSIALMWISISASCLLLALARTSPPWALIVPILIAGLFGTWFIWGYRRD